MMNSLALNSGFSFPVCSFASDRGECPSCARRGDTVEKTTKRNKIRRYLIVFKPFLLYKDFFFNAFSIIFMVNNENAKYSTKNNKIYFDEVFFATANQARAIKSSTRNLTPTATKVCIA
jgi:hypothetical protein